MAGIDLDLAGILGLEEVLVIAFFAGGKKQRILAEGGAVVGMFAGIKKANSLKSMS